MTDLASSDVQNQGSRPCLTYSYAVGGLSITDSHQADAARYRLTDVQVVWGPTSLDERTADILAQLRDAGHVPLPAAAVPIRE